MRLPKHRTPTHPGEVLLKEFLEPYGLTQKELSRRIGVSYPRVNELIHGKRGVTPDTALRLAKLFGTTPEFWLNLQLAYDLYLVQKSANHEDIKPLRQGVA
ncbi:HigA family addiction module antitoxin [Oceanithermus sp.]|uniref:HigA family addiction module antitoxin n=1 Tax=Oceanithermus sp. TaxID=2268145 RepID=UPI00257E7B9E|nr:HigA family addiction module antitoxin [Oceanithermus sp.]